MIYFKNYLLNVGLALMRGPKVLNCHFLGMDGLGLRVSWSNKFLGQARACLEVHSEPSSHSSSRFHSPLCGKIQWESIQGFCRAANIFLVQLGNKNLILCKKKNQYQCGNMHQCFDDFYLVEVASNFDLLNIVPIFLQLFFPPFHPSHILEFFDGNTNLRNWKPKNEIENYLDILFLQMSWDSISGL